MVKLYLNIEMPKGCSDCPLADYKSYYCHGRAKFKTWEIHDIYLHNGNRPEWCPLIEVENEA